MEKTKKENGKNSKSNLTQEQEFKLYYSSVPTSTIQEVEKQIKKINERIVGKAQIARS